jgi:hypothetical protein
MVFSVKMECLARRARNYISLPLQSIPKPLQIIPKLLYMQKESPGRFAMHLIQGLHRFKVGLTNTKAYCTVKIRNNIPYMQIIYFSSPCQGIRRDA